MTKLVVFLALFSALVALTQARVVCYFTSWTIYRPGDGKFQASDVNAHLCSHLLYAFVGLNADGSVWMMDDWEATGLAELEHLMSLKLQNPDLKVMLSMGGWNEGSQKYSAVAADAGLRANMVNSVMSFVNQHGFDGFDLDWEYPDQRGGVENDQANYVTVLGELKAALNAQGKILSAAVGGGVASASISYPNIKAVSDNLDLINVMAYDFHGAFEPFVGHHAPLHPSHLDVTAEQKSLNVAAGIQYWLDHGADPSKMNLGVGTYGRSFTLVDPAKNNLYDPANGGGTAGPFTRQDGILGYNEICANAGSWEYVFDEEQKVPHKVQGNQWVGFEDEASLAIKVEFAKDKKLGGIMVWSLDTDDFAGHCGRGKYPLLETINKKLI